MNEDQNLPQPAPDENGEASAISKTTSRTENTLPRRRRKGKDSSPRMRWHGVSPLFIILPIVLVVTLAVVWIIVATTKPATQKELRTTLYVNDLLAIAVEVKIPNPDKAPQQDEAEEPPLESENGNEGEKDEQNASMITVVRWGYIDKKGEFAIEPVFLNAKAFSGVGLAAVETEQGWGYINRNGEFAIPAEFEDAHTFADSGYAAVRQNGSWGYIKKNGNFFVNPQFDEAYPFTDKGLAMVQIGGKYGYINRAGVYVIVPRYENAESFREDGTALVYEFGYWGIINTKGEYTVNPQFDSVSKYSQGLARVSKDGKFGYIDEKGVYAVRPIYDQAEDFAPNGLALVKKDGVYSFINRKNEIVLTGFVAANSFGDNGIASVKNREDGHWIFIDRNGETIFESEWPEVSRFSYGYALVRNSEGQLAFINEKMKTVILCPKHCATATPFFEDGFALLIMRYEEQDAPYYMLINKAGHILQQHMIHIALD